MPRKRSCSESKASFYILSIIFTCLVVFESEFGPSSLDKSNRMSDWIDINPSAAWWQAEKTWRRRVRWQDHRWRQRLFRSTSDFTVLPDDVDHFGRLTNDHCCDGSWVRQDSHRCSDFFCRRGQEQEAGLSLNVLVTNINIYWRVRTKRCSFKDRKISTYFTWPWIAFCICTIKGQFKDLLQKSRQHILIEQLGTKSCKVNIRNFYTIGNRTVCGFEFITHVGPEAEHLEAMWALTGQA